MGLLKRSLISFSKLLANILLFSTLTKGFKSDLYFQVHFKYQ